MCSQVWHSLKMVSPVKTTRSAGTYTATCPGVWPGVWINSKMCLPTRRVTSPVKTIAGRLGSSKYLERSGKIAAPLGSSVGIASAA